jgi:hypothetical protein
MGGMEFGWDRLIVEIVADPSIGESPGWNQSQIQLCKNGRKKKK